MLLGISGVARAEVTSGLSSTGVYSFFTVLESPKLPSFLSSSNNYFNPFVVFPIATLGIMYLADNPSGRFKELKDLEIVHRLPGRVVTHVSPFTSQEAPKQQISNISPEKNNLFQHELTYSLNIGFVFPD